MKNMIKIAMFVLVSYVCFSSEMDGSRAYRLGISYAYCLGGVNIAGFKMSNESPLLRSEMYAENEFNSGYSFGGNFERSLNGLISMQARFSFMHTHYEYHSFYFPNIYYFDIDEGYETSFDVDSYNLSLLFKMRLNKEHISFAAGPDLSINKSFTNKELKENYHFPDTDTTYYPTGDIENLNSFRFGFVIMAQYEININKFVIAPYLSYNYSPFNQAKTGSWFMNTGQGGIDFLYEF